MPFWQREEFPTLKRLLLRVANQVLGNCVFVAGEHYAHIEPGLIANGQKIAMESALTRNPVWLKNTYTR